MFFLKRQNIFFIEGKPEAKALIEVLEKLTLANSLDKGGDFFKATRI